ncbi:sugar ABC transporter substrate-binding protein [Leucobacter japonicus]|uniref:sugar ABC transporter substrate-binding protein n=1 Tax=Leucobacter japonicus TaxID=1461259 RepID=UPI0006A7D9E8|nr:sugar ABC transporter substrate-binding protein [Leucobacter japonicus]
MRMHTAPNPAIRKTATGLALIAALTLTATGCSTVDSGGEMTDESGAHDDIRSSLNWRASDLGETRAALDGDTLTLDLGASQLTIDDPEGLNIAFFNAAMDTTYTQAMAKGVQDMADELGVNVTEFEAGWDANKQLAQIENAIDSGKYNAFVVYAAEGATVCKALTEEAPAANIAVVPVITPLCGKTLSKGQDLVAPGTVSTIMGGGTVEYYEKWADYVSSQITEPTQVVYVAGPSAQDVVMAAEEAVRNAAEKNPNFELLEVYYADYSGDSALKATQNALVTHPDTQIVLSHFSTITIGVLSALADANRDDVQVYDLGGDKTVEQPIVEGKVAASVPYFPYTTGACSVDILSSAFQGDSVPQLVLSECGRGGEKTNEQFNTVLDQKIVGDFPFEY